MKRIKRITILTAAVLACFLLITGCTETVAPTSSPITSPDASVPPTSSPYFTETFTPSFTVDANAAVYQPSITVPSVSTYEYNENAQNYFVDAVNGNDATGTGTIDSPFKTIEKAKAFVQPLLASMSSDIVINLRKGTYYLEDTIEFTPDDSGCNGFDVVYRSYDDEKAVISGGTKLSGWTQSDASKNIWSTSAQGIISRTFFVNDVRAQRARTELAELVNDPTAGIMYTDATKLFPGFLAHKDTFTTTDLSWLNYERQDDMEMVFIWLWHAPRVPITEIVKAGDSALFKTTEAAQKALDTHATLSYGSKFNLADSIYYIENAYELLDEPGEWYLNRDNDTIYYIPREGEDMATAETYLGRLENLIEGVADKKSQITNIKFDSLAFMHTTWDQSETEDGWVDIQAGFYSLAPNYSAAVRPSAAIKFTYVRHIDFVGCTFAHIGNTALDFDTSSQNITLASNHVYDISSNGFMLGGHSDGVDYQPRASQRKLLISTDNLIIDNTFTQIGAEYYDACAIVRGYTYNTIVAYNTIYDIPYTGMSIGWGWGHGEGDRNKTEKQYPDGMFSGNAVLCNRIDRACQILADGGGIYTLGRQDGMIIAGNYVTRIGEQGIYLDNGSGNITVTDNVLLNVVRNYVVRGHDNTLKNNYIESAPYADGIQPEFGGIFDIDYTQCSDALRDSVIKTAGTRVPIVKK